MRKLLRAVAVTAALAVTAAQAGAETLADALIAAYKHSHLLDQNQAVLRAADEDVAIAVSALRPTINFVGSTAYTYSEGLNLAGVRASNEGLLTSASLSAAAPAQGQA